MAFEDQKSIDRYTPPKALAGVADNVSPIRNMRLHVLVSLHTPLVAVSARYDAVSVAFRSWYDAGFSSAVQSVRSKALVAECRVALLPPH